MQRGRKADPPILKVVKGARDADPRAATVDLEPLPGPPADWRPAAKALWHEVVGSIPFGVAGKHDRYAVEVAVVLLAKMRAEPAKLTPALAAQIRTALGELAMTPAARTRFATPPAARGEGDTDPYFED